MARSRSARAASPRTARSTRTPESSSRSWTCRRTSSAAAADRCSPARARPASPGTSHGGDGRDGRDRPADGHGRRGRRRAHGRSDQRRSARLRRHRGARRSGSGSCPGRPSVTSGSSGTVPPPARRRPEHAIDRRAGRRRCRRSAADRGRPRGSAGHRVGDRRRRHALDPPGPTDDGAATRRVVGGARAAAPTPARSDSASGSPSR